jgi:hypothetical protein
MTQRPLELHTPTGELNPTRDDVSGQQSIVVTVTFSRNPRTQSAGSVIPPTSGGAADPVQLVPDCSETATPMK